MESLAPGPPRGDWPGGRGVSGAGWGAGVREAAPRGSRVRVPAPAHRCDELRRSQPAAGPGGNGGTFLPPGDGGNDGGPAPSSEPLPPKFWVPRAALPLRPPGFGTREGESGHPTTPLPGKKGERKRKKKNTVYFTSLHQVHQSAVSGVSSLSPPNLPPPVAASPHRSPGTAGGEGWSPPALLASSLGWEEEGRGCCLRFGVCSPPQTLSGQWGVR